jgi:hypothetical protein
MPTRKLVDHIWQNSEIKLEPVTYVPVGNENESVQKFIEHHAAIEAQLVVAGGMPGDLIGGTKKDVVLSNLIVDPTRPNHVVIYGWHRLSGLPIQPLSNIHINTYVDYSHGIRLIDSEIQIDDSLTTVQNVLKDAILYKVLSDESGAMTQPTYILDNDIPGKPRSFGIKVESEGTVKILIDPVVNADQYLVYTSQNGLTFNPAIVIGSTEYTIDQLPADSIFFFKVAAENTAGRSTESEVLAALPAASGMAKMLVVYGFDRPSTGNTYDFIRQHATAIVENEYAFESATNEAVVNGLFNLNDYTIVDYVLGDESTVDETFSSSEQGLVSDFLRAGGRLFVSGAEIAWDLDYRGSTADKAFFHDYLKSQYLADAPGNVSGTNYSATGTAGGIFESIGSILFDDGTHGTIDVRYADVVNPLSGSREIVTYSGVSSYTIGGISFEGMFEEGTKAGKLVYLGFPFETVYPAETRHLIMHEILAFLQSDVSSAEPFTDNTPDSYQLEQNYPNPFNVTTAIGYQLSAVSQVEVNIYNLLGQKVAKLVNERQPAGRYRVHWDASGSPSGTYYYQITAGEFQEVKRMTLLK